MDRDTNRVGEVGDASINSLADPPRGIRRELVPLGEIELLNCSDQTEVALLDEVEE